MDFAIKGVCPLCRSPVTRSSIDLDPFNREQAVLYFECLKCGRVEIKTIPLRCGVLAKEPQMAKYQNREVTVVRPAHAGDVGYDPDNKADQVLIKDGPSQKAVLKSDVTE